MTTTRHTWQLRFRASSASPNPARSRPFCRKPLLDPRAASQSMARESYTPSPLAAPVLPTTPCKASREPGICPRSLEMTSGKQAQSGTPENPMRSVSATAPMLPSSMRSIPTALTSPPHSPQRLRAVPIHRLSTPRPWTAAKMSSRAGGRTSMRSFLPPPSPLPPSTPEDRAPASASMRRTPFIKPSPTAPASNYCRLHPTALPSQPSARRTSAIQATLSPS